MHSKRLRAWMLTPWAAALAWLALAVQISAPPGYMPGSAGGSAALVLCSGQSSAAPALPSAPLRGQDHDSCIFALAGPAFHAIPAWRAPPRDPLPMAEPETGPAPQRPDLRAGAMPPPQTGPPAQA